MNRRSIARVVILCAALSSAITGHTVRGEPNNGAADASPSQSPTSHPSIEAARERAQLMHRIYSATLDAMHHHYFHSNKAVLPARAMEDVFAEVARGTRTTARWISVNTKAMSIDHEPKSEFEKAAAKELSTGKAEFALVEEGYYRYAGVIPLAEGCVSCHTGGFGKPAQTQRYAGLVISVPVDKD